MTKPVSTLGKVHRYLRVPESASVPYVGRARIAAFLPLPEILSEFGIDVREVMHEARVRADIFDDPDNLIPYPDVGRLLSVSARRTNCDYIGLLIGQRSRLTNLGLAGEVALCADTADQGLRHFSNYFTLQNTAATVSVFTSGSFTRLVYAIAEPQMGDTGHIQLGAIALAFNILQELCGSEWLPTVVTVASSAPSNLRPCQKFFRAPLRFDSDETALVFESHWLDRLLPPLNPLKRRRIEAEVRAQQASILADFPTTVRRVLRKQLFMGDFSMVSMAARLGIHRRTLDRRLKQHDMSFSDLLESVKCEVACQLLRDTHLRIQQVAESLCYGSAANFSTAFRRWTGLTPSAYRRYSR